jgi:hypothetical protein
VVTVGVRKNIYMLPINTSTSVDVVIVMLAAVGHMTAFCHGVFI